MKKSIENIGKKVVEFLYDFENNDYELEGGYYEPDNGICEAASVSIYGNLTIFGHEATVNVDTKYNGYIEVWFEDDEYFNIEEAVNKYVENKLDLRDLYTSAIEHYEINYGDEYERNGFRDEADYIRYRYSA